mmetsp:Transcript_10137/g.18258  ORF Transcript_10137/g.18258 Transcript_10137/m.18258 type:complete len:323 (+) Transcript_10137:70-1038(+)
MRSISSYSNFLIRSQNIQRYWKSTAFRSFCSSSSHRASIDENSTESDLKSKENEDLNDTSSSEYHPRMTHFGFQSVREEFKSTLVGNVFSNVASSYDIMNDLMSGGIHRLWKDSFVKSMNAMDTSLDILDVAGGTGDIGMRIVEHRRKQKNSSSSMSSPVMVCDVNQKMLDIGKKRAVQRGYSSSEITFFKADAECLAIENGSVDIYCISFGMRNVTHPDVALLEAKRVLKPGGRFMMLEFGKVENGLLGPLYDAYSFNVIPALGSLVASDRESYEYLVQSIRRFPSQSEFCAMMDTAGFKCITHTNYTGGVAVEYSGFKLD